MLLLGLLVWLVIGLLIGYIATRMIDLRGDDPRLGMGVAAAAALIGGLGYVLISSTPVALTNYWSHGYAALAAILSLIAWHLLRHRQPYDRPSVRRSY